MLQKYAPFIVLCLFLAASSFYAGWSINGNRWEVKNLELKTQYAQEKQLAATEALNNQQKLMRELNNAYETSKALQEKHDSYVADARAASDRMRSEIERIKALPKISNTSTIAQRANAATDRIVLANLLAISDQRAGEYAEQADKHRIALMACNAEYNALR